ncbi:LLM class flavin-dependent oxidoreductase [Actinosynnema sp. NPDC023794]
MADSRPPRPTPEPLAPLHATAGDVPDVPGRLTPPRTDRKHHPQPLRTPPAFRPILGATEELAWEKAHRTVDAIKSRTGGANPLTRRHSLKNPENAGSQRLLEIAGRGDRFDRALWTPTAAATGGAGNSNALVGTPETVAQALLDYYDLGVGVMSARGYDMVDDTIDFGRHVIPIVREEVAKRDRERAAAVVA